MKRLVLSAAGIAFAVFFLYKRWTELIGVLSALGYMAVFSVVLSPVCVMLERKGMRPAHAAASSVIGLFVVALIVLAAFIPYLITQSEYLLKRISPVAAELMDQLTKWNDGVGFVHASMAENGGILGTMISWMTEKLVRGGMSAAKQIGRIAFSLVLTYYVLCDRKRIGSHLLLLIPSLWRKPVLAALCACKNALMSYLSGLLKTSAFVTLATGIGLWPLGVQDAILLALLMGVMEVLPYIGPVLAAVPILLSALMQGAETALFTLILLIAIQQIEGSLVSPYFTASSTAVHPLAAILAVFVMGSLTGVWGVLLAVPVLVVLQSMIWSLRQTQLVMSMQQFDAEKVLFP